MLLPSISIVCCWQAKGGLGYFANCKSSMSFLNGPFRLPLLSAFNLVVFRSGCLADAAFLNSDCALWSTCSASVGIIHTGIKVVNMYNYRPSRVNGTLKIEHIYLFLFISIALCLSCYDTLCANQLGWSYNV